MTEETPTKEFACYQAAMPDWPSAASRFYHDAANDKLYIPVLAVGILALREFQNANREALLGSDDAISDDDGNAFISCELAQALSTAPGSLALLEKNFRGVIDKSKAGLNQ